MTGTIRSCQGTAREGPASPHAFRSCALPTGRRLPLAHEIRASRIQHGQPPPGKGHRPCGCICSGQKTSPGTPPPPYLSATATQAPMARAASPVDKATTLRFLPPQPPPSRAASGRRCSCEEGHLSTRCGGRSLRRPCAASEPHGPPAASHANVGASSITITLPPRSTRSSSSCTSESAAGMTSRRLTPLRLMPTSSMQVVDSLAGMATPLLRGCMAPSALTRKEPRIDAMATEPC